MLMSEWTRVPADVPGATLRFRPRTQAREQEIKVATVMTVTLSTDHRTVDGALGAELISAFKQFIENPMSMLV